MIILALLVGLYFGAASITFVEEYDEAVIHRNKSSIGLAIACLFWPYKYYYKYKN
jgi:hypothetical protein